MRVYLDVCCLNRPFDDQTQDRIRLESEAVLLVIGHFSDKDWQWISSDAVAIEVEQNPDGERRHRVQRLASSALAIVHVEQEQLVRSQELVVLGFSSLDALHLACAEAGSADIFLTTDDRLLRLAVRVASQLKVRVANPLRWLEEGAV